MAKIVFPSENDIGGSNKGRAITEEFWQRLFGDWSGGGAAMIAGRSYVKEGLTIASTSGLIVTFNGGWGVIDGYVFQFDATEPITVPSSSTVNIWAQLTFTSNKVASLALIYDATLTNVPPRALLLARVTSGASTITSTVDVRPLNPRVLTGNYVGDNTDDRRIYLGSQPKIIVVFSSGSFAISILGATSGWNSVAGSSSADHFRPTPQTWGFTVSHDAAGGSLNSSGTTYWWAAVL